MTTTDMTDATNSHLSHSTLGGEAGPLVDRFRELQFKEYQGVQKKCRECPDVQLSEQSLKKGNIENYNPGSDSDIPFHYVH